MKKYLFISTVLILCLLSSCTQVNDIPENASAVSETTDKNNTIEHNYQKIENVSIPQNIPSVEKAAGAWTVKILQTPEDLYYTRVKPSAGTIKYYENEQIFRMIYDTKESAAYGGNENRPSLATYDCDGNLLKSEKLPAPEASFFGLEKYYARWVILTDDGYTANFWTEDGSIKGLYRYSFETEEFEILFDDLGKLSSFDIFGKTVITDDGYYIANSSDVFVLDTKGNLIFRESCYTAFDNILLHNNTVYIHDYSGHYWIPDHTKFEDYRNNSLSIPDFPKSPENFTHDYSNPSNPLSIDINRMAVLNSRHRFLGIGHDMFYIYDDGIYAQDYIGLDEPTEPEMILNFANSGISSETAKFHSMIDENTFVAEVKDLFNFDTAISAVNTAWSPALITYDPVKAAQGKQTITLAHTQPLDQYIRSTITYFNLNSEDYRLVTLDYTKYTSDEFPDGAADQLMKEFGTGKYPDLLFITDDIDYNNLTAKGFMSDMYELGFDKSKLLNSVRTKSEYGGGLYRLPMLFEFTALVNADGIESMTIRDMAEMYAVYRNDLFPQLERAELLEYLINAGILGKFISYGEAKCNFNDSEFIEFLEFIRGYTNQKESDLKLGHYYMDQLDNRTVVKDGAAIFFIAQSGHFSGSLYKLHYLYGEEGYSFSGFPTSSGSGIVIKPSYEFGITKASANPSGALEFLMLLFEGYISEEKLWPDELHSCTEILHNRLMKAYRSPGDYYTAYNTQSDVVSLVENKTGSTEKFIKSAENSEIHELFTVSDTEIEAFVESILNADVRPAEDAGLLDILYDELNTYLGGQDTAANTANRINSRVGIYLAERYS